jgi:hypothetical protein
MRGSTREEALQASLGLSCTRGDEGMRELAEAIERATGGNRDGLRGLDWTGDGPERE